MGASVAAVSLSTGHTSTVKENQNVIRVVAGEGVAGDGHCGKLVQHIYNMRQDATQPNLRQVHLIHSELHDELKAAGFKVEPGQMGENITTRGLDVLSLPLGTRLHIGSGVILELTGVRNACSKLNRVQSGLQRAVQFTDQQGNLVRKAGVMSVVRRGGEVRPGDEIQVDLPAHPHQALPPL